MIGYNPVEKNDKNAQKLLMAENILVVRGPVPLCFVLFIFEWGNGGK